MIFQVQYNFKEMTEYCPDEEFDKDSELKKKQEE
jgi:hypothetical protein